ncbi:helix-turn-helix transcriptional regulator [uncultured Mailhella sp.]|uniref:helix-turn-helix transcriptional regulator n=1 Tax=uncultured Mailhella sp. TaxID=1981031 RepID=UPI0025CE56EE|nr:helix-turn-helix transcriptional regulator [uncultured Mailhella sp.]
MDVLDSCACSGGNLPRFVQPVLLALLAKEPMHGYALVQKLEETGLFAEQPPDMTGCYRMLRDMEKNGVLETKPDRGDGPARRKYAVTALGRRCLNRWISSLAGNRDHLDRVLALLVSAREEGGAFGSDCPEEDRAFMQDVRKRALNGGIPRRDEVVRLLSYAPDSPQAAYLGRLARQTARDVAGNRAGVWAAVGVDCAPCSMSCAFCAFGESWGVVKEAHEWSVERIADTARRFALAGASWVVLRTTEHYGAERLSALAAAVRAHVPSTCALVANTGQMSVDEIRRLGEAGVKVMYHALRLGEGRDTPFDPAGRRLALGRIREAGMELAHLVEPLGPEHGNEEIADVLLTALHAGARVCGVMARSNVPGTPFEGQDAVSDARLALVASVVRLCGGRNTPYVCVHPPVSLAVERGANVVVVETGAIPRDRKEAGAEWRGFSMKDAVSLLARHGYEVGGFEA